MAIPGFDLSYFLRIWLDSTEIDRIERTDKEKIGFLGLFVKAFKRPK